MIMSAHPHEEGAPSGVRFSINIRIPPKTKMAGTVAARKLKSASMSTIDPFCMSYFRYEPVDANQCGTPRHRTHSSALCVQGGDRESGFSASIFFPFTVRAKSRPASLMYQTERRTTAPRMIAPR